MQINNERPNENSIRKSIRPYESVFIGHKSLHILILNGSIYFRHEFIVLSLLFSGSIDIVAELECRRQTRWIFFFFNKQLQKWRQNTKPSFKWDIELEYNTANIWPALKNKSRQNKIDWLSLIGVTHYATKEPEGGLFCCFAHINWLNATLTCWMLILILTRITLRAPKTMEEWKSKHIEHIFNKFGTVLFAVFHSFELFFLCLQREIGEEKKPKKNWNEEINETFRLFANDDMKSRTLESCNNFIPFACSAVCIVENYNVFSPLSSNLFTSIDFDIS